MRDMNNKKYEIKEQPKENTTEPKQRSPVETVEREIFPALKIKIRSDNKSSGPIRLNMGRSLQPKWV
jgi:hypothetical protein